MPPPIVQLAAPPLAVLGYLRSIRQPALVARLTITAPPSASFPGLKEINAAIRQAVAGKEVNPDGENPDALPVSRQIATHLLQWSCTLQIGSGMPILSDGVIQKAGEEWILKLPCMDDAFRQVAILLKALVDITNLGLQGEPMEPALARLRQIFKALGEKAPQGMNTLNFIRAAHAAHIPWRRISGNVFQFGWGARARWLDSSFTDATPGISTRIARNKVQTAAVLKRAGLPVPEHALAKNEDEAVSIADKLGYPVVVKPADQDGGQGVAAGLRDAEGVRNAFQLAHKLSRSVLVEKHVHGNDYRLQVYQGQVFWAVRRVPGGVTGDGTHTIRELLDRLNANPARGPVGSKALLKHIDMDQEASLLLQDQHLSLDSVPEQDRFVRLRQAANVASGGTPQPVLDEAHPDNLDLASRAARVLRLDLAGVDLLIPDIRRSWTEGGAAICEVNAQPQLSPHLPEYLLSRLVAGQGRIPVVAVLGHGANPDYAQKLADALHGMSGHAGLATAHAARVGGRVVCSDAADVFSSTESLLLDPDVHALVISIEDMSLNRTGLPVDRFDALVLSDWPSLNDRPQFAKQWLQFAGGIMQACDGPVFVNTTWGDPDPLAAHFASREMRRLPDSESVAALRVLLGQ